MQLIHETNKDVYILFTRWGRIGTPGQLQMTPFDKPNAIKEFHSIIKSKSGNIWEEIIAGKPFQKQQNKYLLLNHSIKKYYKQLMQRFDFSEKNKNLYPKHHLERNVARFLLQLCQVKLYQRDLLQIRVDHELLPLECLDKYHLKRAQNILKELEEFALELEKERKQPKLNDDRIFELFASINQKSTRYYELIPYSMYRLQNRTITTVGVFNKS